MTIQGTFTLRDEQQDTAVLRVLQERWAQDQKWGDQTIPGMRDPFEWLAILMEEVGELSEQILTERFGEVDPDELYQEAVQVAAVGLAIVEALEKRNVNV